MNKRKIITAILTTAMLMTQMSGFDVFANYGSGKSGGKAINNAGQSAVTTSAAPAPSIAPTIEHRLSYVLDGGTYENAPEKYIQGIGLVLGEPTKEGFIFDGWQLDPDGDGIFETLVDNKIDYRFNTDLTLYAKWATAYTVRYDFGGVTTAKMPDGYVTKYKKGSNTIPLPVPTAAGYKFKGWADSDLTMYTVIDTSNPKNLALTAQWDKISCVVNYMLDGGINPDDAVYAYTADTETFNLPLPTKEGFIFDGWYSNNEFTGEKITQVVKGTDTDTTVYAKWKQAYKIIYNNVDGVTNFENAPMYFAEDSETIDLPAPVKDGYVFDGWYSNNEFTGEKVTQIAKGTKNDVEVFAKWLKEYKITYYNLENAQNFENAPLTFTEDSEIVLSAATKDGTKFLGWRIDTDNDGKPDTKIEKITKGTTGDINLYADWEETCNIIYNTNGGVLPENTVTTYTTGIGAELAIPERTGYNFKGWYTDEQFTSPISKITEDMRGDIAVYATWQRRGGGGTLGGAKYYVKFDSCGGSDVSDQLLQAGATARKPENPTRKGYTFAGWYTDKNYKDKFDFDTKIRKTTYLYAKWTKIGEVEQFATEFDKVLILTIGSKEAKLNGKTVRNDVAPVLKNNRTMLPIRFIAESLGAKVEWDPEFRIVTVNSGSRQVIIHIGSDIAYVNGSIYNLDSPAYIENDRTYIPVRFVTEAIDCEVDWNEDESKVYILKK